MYIPKSNYQRKPTAHGSKTIKDVILDKSHLPNLLQFAKSYFRKGDYLEKHFHESMSEVFNILKGKVSVTYGNEKFTAVSGDSFYIKTKIEHSFEFLEDTEFLYFNLEDNE